MTSAQWKFAVTPHGRKNKLSLWILLSTYTKTGSPTGFYLYKLNFGAEEELAEKLLEAAAKHLPIETATEINDNPTEEGLIRRRSIPKIE